MTEPSLLDLAGRFARFCEGAGVPYMVMGGLAVAVHAIPRPTLDLDVTVDLDPDRLPEFLERATEADFSVADHYRSGFSDPLKGMRKIQMQFFAAGLVHDVDVFLVTTDYQRAAFARRQKAKLGSHEVFVIAPEDLILHKLLTGRGRDESDVDDILMLSRLDLDYLRRWAGELSVRETLDGKLRQLEMGGT
ncbi:MAG: DUF6036 family nucleotidyltransferase [Planctomycetales bacterium]|nr:DUF6036 family nucleotidyltransferase [Planctomycetales bacterium]